MDEPKKDIQEIKRDVERLRGNLKDLLHSMADIGGDAAVALERENIELELQGLLEKINKRYQDLRLQSSDFADRARDTVEQRPIASMLIALAAGALLGGIASRK